MASTRQLRVRLIPELATSAVNSAAGKMRNTLQGAMKGLGLGSLFDNSKINAGAAQAKGSISLVGKAFESLKGVARSAGETAKRALESAGESARGMGQKFRESLSGMGGAVKIAGIGALAVGVGAVTKSMIDGNAQMEMYNTQLSVLIGDAGKTDKLMADLKKFGAETPFEFPELAEASRNLIAFGFSAQETVPELKKIGDISSAVGAPLGELAELYGKARVQGTLMSEDINQLVGRGVPVIQEFAKQLGVSEGEVKKMASEGKIQFSNLQQAFTDLTSEGGKFSGMMEAQSKTFNGMMSTLKDNLGGIVRELGGPLFEAVKGGLGQLMTILGGEAVQKAVGSIGKALGSVVSILLGVFEKILPAVTSLLEPIGTVIVTLMEPIGALLEGVLTPVSAMIQEIAGPLGNLLVAVATVISGVLLPVISALTPLLSSITEIIGSVVAVVASLLAAIMPLIGAALQPLVVVITVLASVLQAVLDPIASVISQFADFAQKLLTELQPAIDEASKLFKEVATLIGGVLASGVKAAIGLFFDMARIVGDLVLKIFGAKNATDLFQKVLSIVKTVVDKVVSGFRLLRGVVEGVRMAFEVVKQTLKTFIDAVLSLDVKAAIKAFAGFGDRIGAAYKKGFDSVVNADSASAQIKTAEEAARTTTEEESKKTTAVVKKKAKDDAKEIAKLRADLQKEIAKAESKGRIEAIEDARQRELIALKESFDAEVAETKERYKKLGETDADLQRLLALKEGQYRYDREELIKKLTQQGLKEEGEVLKKGIQDQIEIVRSEMETITGEGLAAIRRRYVLRREELALQQRLELAQIAQQTEAFQTYLAEIDRQVLEGTLTPTEASALYEAKVAAIIEGASAGSKIANAAKSFAKRFEELSLEEQEKARAQSFEAARRSIVARTTDLALQEHKLRMLELNKALKEELAAALGNEALEARAHRQFLVQKFDLEQEWLRRSNEAVAASLALEKGIREAFQRGMGDAERQGLEDRKARAEQEISVLKDQLHRGLIAHAEYNRELERLYGERADAVAALEEGQGNILKGFLRGIADAAKSYEEEKRAAIEESVTRLTDMSKLGLAFTGEAAREQLNLLASYGKVTLAELTGAFSTMLEQGKIDLAALGNIVIKNLFDLAQKEILILTPTIYAKSFALLGPIFGAIAATGAIAVVQGGLALARSVAKFHTGGVDIARGEVPRGREFPALMLAGETVFDIPTTDRERELFEHLHAGGASEDFFLNRYGHLFVDVQGNLRVAELAGAVAEQGRQIGALTDTLNSVAESNKAMAARFESRQSVRHEFGPIELDGDTIRASVDRSKLNDLTRG